MEKCDRDKYPLAFGCEDGACCFRRHINYIFLFISLGLLVIAVLALIEQIVWSHPRRRKLFHELQDTTGDIKREQIAAETRFPKLSKVINDEEENDKKAGLDPGRKRDLDPPPDKPRKQVTSVKNAQPRMKAQPSPKCAIPPPPCKHSKKSFKAPVPVAPPVLKSPRKKHVHGLLCKHFHHKSPLSKKGPGMAISPKGVHSPPTLRTASPAPSPKDGRSPSQLHSMRQQQSVMPSKQPMPVPVKKSIPMATQPASPFTDKPSIPISSPSISSAPKPAVSSPSLLSRSFVEKDGTGSSVPTKDATGSIRFGVVAQPKEAAGSSIRSNVLPPTSIGLSPAVGPSIPKDEPGSEDSETTR